MMNYLTRFLDKWRNSSAMPACLITLLILTTAIPSPLWAADCTPSSIGLYTQADVDNFQDNHGPCDRVVKLHIEGADIANLDGLSVLTRVFEVTIGNNAALTNLDGLSALTSVGGSVYAGQRSLLVENNPALANLDGLSALTSVGGHPGSYTWVIINNNTKLTSIDGLSALTGIWGDLIITNNAALINVDGLSVLTRVFEVTIGNNAALNNLDGLSALTNLLQLVIVENNALTNLDGLSTLTSVWRYLGIQNNRALSNLDGLSGITYVGSDLDVQYNDILAQYAGLSDLLDQWDDAEQGPGPGAGGVPDVGGDVLLGDNLAGCNSIEKILAGVDISKINAGLNDAWYYPETDGQGFFITIFPDLGVVSLAWFTYDTELPADDVQANLGDAGHRWLTALGPIDGNQVIMNIDIASGGIFDTTTDIQHTDPPGSDGTIVLTFDSCNSATVEYDIPSINRQGTVPIRRVADDNVVLCEALNAERLN